MQRLHLLAAACTVLGAGSATARDTQPCAGVSAAVADSAAAACLLAPAPVCTRQGVCHRDLKLENTLLDGSPAPRVKICDFGYSKSVLDSQPKSTVGTPAYIAPEVGA